MTDMKKNYLNKLFNLKNKIVLITGACGQLGRELAESYILAGARVIGADLNLDSKNMIKSKNIEYLKMDITNKKSALDTFSHVYSNYKRLDILINNAGASVFEPFEERQEESFERVMDVNLKGTFFCIQAYVKYLKEKKHPGSIVNIASIYGVISPDFRIYTDCKRKNSEVYGATKSGVIQMTRYFAVHLAQYNIRVNCVSPGGIFNPKSPQGKDFIKNYSQRCPMGRMAVSSEIAGGVLYLSSDASKYVTGENLVIDGGMNCW